MYRINYFSFAILFLLVTIITSTTWGAGVYEVWGGNTDYTSEPQWWNYYYNIDKQDYTKLGESAGESRTFNGSYDWYVVAAHERFLLDCVRSSNDTYPASWWSGNTSDWDNISGPPDGQYATVGYQDSGGTFRGFVIILGTGNWTSITVISDLPSPSQVDLVISNTSPTSVVAQPGEDVTITVTTKILVTTTQSQYTKVILIRLFIYQIIYRLIGIC